MDDKPATLCAVQDRLRELDLNWPFKSGLKKDPVKLDRTLAVGACGKERLGSFYLPTKALVVFCDDRVLVHQCVREVSLFDVVPADSVQKRFEGRGFRHQSLGGLSLSLTAA
jgi:hypothetical protein